MSLQLHQSPSSTARASHGAGAKITCWSPLAEREHRIVCTTSTIECAVPPHMHAQHHLGVVERGTAALRSEGRRWTVAGGDVIWHPPRQLHSITAEYCRCRWIAVDEPVVEGIGAARRMPVPNQTHVIPAASRAAELLALHRRLERGAMTHSDASTLVDAIVGIGGAPANGGLLSPLVTPQLERCRRAMRNRYADGLRLSDLASIAEMSLFHLARTFARAFGVPPHTYLLHLRVASAQSLLKRGVSGSRVAYAVGFADQSHCIRVHRRILGASPLGLLRLERGLPATASGFADLRSDAVRAAISLWLP